MFLEANEEARNILTGKICKECYHYLHTDRTHQLAIDPPPLPNDGDGVSKHFKSEA